MGDFTTAGEVESVTAHEVINIIDYVKNPQKTDFGKFIYGYECDTRTADAEFLLSKRQYANLTGRDRGADDVIAYHLRQAFKPGEVTPKEANQIGRELALKLTKGNHAFVVCTHVDKRHVHNHIIINSATLDYQKKFLPERLQPRPYFIPRLFHIFTKYSIQAVATARQ